MNTHEMVWIFGAANILFLSLMTISYLFLNTIYSFLLKKTGFYTAADLAEIYFRLLLCVFSLTHSSEWLLILLLVHKNFYDTQQCNYSFNSNRIIKQKQLNGDNRIQIRAEYHLPFVCTSILPNKDHKLSDVQLSSSEQNSSKKNVKKAIASIWVSCNKKFHFFSNSIGNERNNCNVQKVCNSSKSIISFPQAQAMGWILRCKWLIFRHHYRCWLIVLLRIYVQQQQSARVAALTKKL